MGVGGAGEGNGAFRGDMDMCGSTMGLTAGCDKGGAVASAAASNDRAVEG